MIELQGLDTLLKAFRDLEHLDATDALQAGGAVLLEGMRQRVAVDTGELRDSLRVEVTDDGASVVTDSDHALANEFGTHQMPAQPFMRPTVDEDGDKALDAVAKALTRQIEQVG